MSRAEVIARLLSVEPLLRARGVSALYLFGSRARDEARPDSDVDVFVDPADDQAFGLSDFNDTYTVLEGALPRIAFGYSTRDGLAPFYRQHIERDAIRVF